MAVLETASSCTKSAGASKARRRLLKCLKASKNGQFYLSKMPPAQWVRAQAAPIFIVPEWSAVTAFAPFMAGRVKVGSRTWISGTSRVGSGIASAATRASGVGAEPF
jgi:hypothetical protein